eukprot:jgi/Botrbrau1/15641/Bobra.4_1s0026.1
MPDAHSSERHHQSDEDPLLQGGRQGLSTSPIETSGSGRFASFRRAFRWGARTDDGTTLAAGHGNDGTNPPVDVTIGDAAQCSTSPQLEGVTEAGGGPSAIPAGEISPSTSGIASAERRSDEDGPGRGSDPSSSDGLEGQQKRSSSSSPRSQDGGGLLDRFLGNIAESLSLKRVGSSAAMGQGTCLICLENVGPEDFESGEAMQLDCACRGEMAVRHRSCAEKWSKVKGDRVCDVCKKEIKNLPELPPPAEGDQDTMIDINMFDDSDHPGHPHGLGGPFMGEVPGSADVVFDLIRVTWVAMIICILFLEMSLPMSLWTGLIVGIAYTLFVKLMYRSQMAALQREYAREQSNLEGGPALVVPGVAAVPPMPRIVTIV